MNVKKFKDLIESTQKYVWENAETGYKEWKTHNYMKSVFESLGYEVTEAGNIPGFYTVLDTGREGPEVMILAELDSLVCFNHPDSNKETGAVHCCGHSAQCAAMAGVAAALKEEGALDGLSGRIRLVLVPAEELIEIEYRSKLKEEGVIKYFGGKSEFLHRGYFDGVDIAFMVHTTPAPKFLAIKGAVGMITKKAVYKGVSAHAGGAPWNGKNALYAANAGLNAANAVRETFNDIDYIRFHPIITTGGTVVNAIPEKVVIESYIRGLTYDAILKANKRITKALIGGALSLDNNIEIIDNPGYAPMVNNPVLLKLYGEAVEKLGYEFEYSDTIGTGSTDMGDLSQIMPAIHPYAPGASGTSHGDNYYITNTDTACVGSAEVQLELLKMLLSDNAAKAKEIIKNFKPCFKSKKEYLDYIDSLECSGDRITYTEEGATVRL